MANNNYLGTGKSTEKLAFVLSEFSGGLVNNVADCKMADNESPDMLNMVFRNDGLIEKRPGVKEISSLPGIYGSNPKVWVVEPEPNDFHLIAYADHTMYYGTGDNLNEVNYWLAFYQKPDREVIDGCQFGDRFYFLDNDGNGNGSLYYFDFNRELGVELVTPDVSAWSPKPSPATEGEEVFTGINPATSCDVSAYIPAQLELEDNYKGSNIIPNGCTMIAVHKDRLYLAGNPKEPNMLYVSDIMKGSYFPVGLCIQTPPTDDLITALDVFDDQLIIGRRDSIYSLSGNSNRPDTSSQYKLQKVNCHTGMINNKSSDIIHSLLFFIGSDGNLYKLRPLSQYSNTLATTKLNTKLDLLEKPFSLKKQHIEEAFTCYDKINGLWYIQIAHETIIYHYDLMAFTRFNNIFALQFFMVNNELFFVKSGGTICRFSKPSEAEYYYDIITESTLSTPLKVPICAYWTSKAVDMGVPAIVKRFRNVYVVAESNEYFKTQLHMDFDVDYVDVKKSFDLFNEVPKWNMAKWNEYNWVTRNLNKSLPIPINRRGRTLRVKYGCGYPFAGTYISMPNMDEIEEGQLIYVFDEERYWLRTALDLSNGEPSYWREFSEAELNQTLIVHNITGIYQLKGYR